MRWLRKAAEQGDAKAQFLLGDMYVSGKGVTKDEVEAVRWLRKAAEQGDAEAQANLGLMYDIGEGVAQDNAEAARWYRKAAEQGHAGAQLLLGVIYATGKGVAEDDAEAARWLRKAAEQGKAEAQLRLGAMYSTGVLTNYVAAYKWLNIAASTGADDQVVKARDLRDLIATEMAAADISEAQRRARICLESDYQQCD